MTAWWLKEDDFGDKAPEWEAVLQAYAGRAATVRGSWLRARCPLCEDASGSIDKKESLGLNPKTAGYNCQKCLIHGRLPASYRERLRDVLDDDVEFATTLLEAEQRVVEYAPGFAELFAGPGLAQRSLDALRSYVTSSKQTLNEGGKKCRGIPVERATEMCIGTGTGKLSGRIVFPIFDWYVPSAAWLGWFARDATGLNPIPHLYSKGLSRHTTIWNGAALHADTDEPLFIMEGCLDAQAVWPHGVACLGKPIKSHHLIFASTHRPIVVCLDGDAWREGQSLAWALMHLGKRAANLRLPPLTDPDEVPPEYLFDEARKLLNK